MSNIPKGKKLRVFETFAGIGAQHKALEYLKNEYGYDYEVVAISEWDISANIAYNAIHHNNKSHKATKDEMIAFLSKYCHSKDGKVPTTINYLMNLDNKELTALYSSYINTNNLGSVTSITGKQLLDSIDEDQVDLITYSFPCQDLSVAGSFHGFNQGMAKELNNRSGLLWEIERIVQELNKLNKLPKFLLLENVKNIISQRHIAQYHLWLKQLKKLGYSTKTFKLNARDYGIPQNRERVYGLSILNYRGKVDKFGEILDLDDPTPITKVKQLKDIIKENYSIDKYKQEAIESQPNRTNSRKKMFDENRKLNNYKVTPYCRTVTTKQDRHPNAGVINLDNTILGGNDRIDKSKANYRFITPREAYLLMGFTERDFDKVKESNIRKEKLYQQAGNSIVVDVMISIMKIIQGMNNE